MTLTPRQLEVLRWIDAFDRAHGYPPSFEEIAHGCGLNSIATVHKHVTTLREKGVIESLFNRSRTLSITKRGEYYLRRSGEVRLLTQAEALCR